MQVQVRVGIIIPNNNNWTWTWTWTWTCIFEFFNPEYLNIFISLLLNSLIKKSWVVIKKIKGKISKIMAGEFKRDKNKGK